MLTTLWNKTSSLVDRIARSLPHFCALCETTSLSGMCDSCLKRYFTHERPRCGLCAHLMTKNRNEVHCGACLKRRPDFDRIITATDYIPPIDQLVQSLKFGSSLALAPLFARLLGETIRKSDPESAALPSMMAPVPLADQRLASRGFNQALEIAKPLSRQLGLPLVPQLIDRIRETPPQTVISLKERRKNIRGAFVINDAFRAKIQGKHIAMIDDVLTTGETMGEVARILKAAGAARVTGIVFARTPL